MTAEQTARAGIDLDRVRAELTAALVSDCLDALGYRTQCLALGIEPLADDMVLAGFAFPVAIRRMWDVPADPFRGLVSALDAIAPDEVFVTPTARATDLAVWGELLATTSQRRGAAGALTDGLVRDSQAIRRLGFPTFAAGTIPYDSKGRHEIVAHRVPCAIDGVRIEPGCLVVGDADGVVVVPPDLIEVTLDAAYAKRRDEARFRAAVTNGMSATAAFDSFGVL